MSTRKAKAENHALTLEEIAATWNRVCGEAYQADETHVITAFQVLPRHNKAILIRFARACAASKQGT